jgi:hypothetical protein
LNGKVVRCDEDMSIQEDQAGKIIEAEHEAWKAHQRERRRLRKQTKILLDELHQGHPFRDFGEFRIYYIDSPGPKHADPLEVSDKIEPSAASSRRRRGA